MYRPDLPDPPPATHSWASLQRPIRPSVRSPRRPITRRPSEMYVATSHMNLSSDRCRTTNVTEEAKSGQVFEPSRNPGQKLNPRMTPPHEPLHQFVLSSPKCF